MHRLLSRSFNEHFASYAALTNKSVREYIPRKKIQRGVLVQGVFLAC